MKGITAMTRVAQNSVITHSTQRIDKR